MKKYYKVIENGYIIAVGTNGNDSCTGTTKAKYEEIRNLILNKPEHDDSHDYRLKEDLTWELISIEPTDITNDELINILLGGETE